MIPPTVYAILYLQDRNLPYLGHPLATQACMTHGTRVRYVLGWSLLASRPVLHCEELSISSGYEGRLIQAVRFEPPLQPLTRAYLARLLPFQPGAAASGRYPRRHQAALHDGRVSEIWKCQPLPIFLFDWTGILT
jgi:hypothetical protein